MANGPGTGGQPSKRARTGARRSSATKGRAAEVSEDKVAHAAVKEGRDSLLSAICHDLRAPLAAVTMGANFVLQTTKRDEAGGRSVRILEAMLRSCSQMERLIRNFADLSEIEADAVALRTGLHDAGELLDLAAEAVRDAATVRSVILEVVKPEPPIVIRCDRDRLLRAISHVVDNAIKHAPAGSTVTLSVGLRSADTVAFAVIDRGSGLAPDVRTNLFDRHWHAKRTNREGAGFGLAIARGFVTAHGGDVEVESVPEVQTKFTLVVPKDNDPMSDGSRAQ
jgi:signal transduction histidine kinase